MPRSPQPLGLLLLLSLAATQWQPWLVGLTAVVVFLFIVFLGLLLNRFWRLRMRRWGPGGGSGGGPQRPTFGSCMEAGAAGGGCVRVHGVIKYREAPGRRAGVRGGGQHAGGGGDTRGASGGGGQRRPAELTPRSGTGGTRGAWGGGHPNGGGGMKGGG
uniref:Uncharacterized protein n=1 Tax=Anas platyrhynchos TaxID=8839 RepID=A0A8B9ZDT4_ANAPL